MKLAYDVDVARQMQATKHIRVEKMYTGLLPNVVDRGTLYQNLSNNLYDRVQSLGDSSSPDKVAKPKDQNRDSSELNSIDQVVVEGFHELRSHRSQGKRTKTLTERIGDSAKNG